MSEALYGQVVVADVVLLLLGYLAKLRLQEVVGEPHWTKVVTVGHLPSLNENTARSFVDMDGDTRDNILTGFVSSRNIENQF